MFLFVIILILFLAYSILVLHYWLAWKRIPVFYASGKKLQTPVSVIIPARNEQAVIGKLLNALEQQTYPRELFEVMVVDDHSSDSTVDIVKSFAWVKLIRLTDDTVNSFKKKAIETGINASAGELIVTTDADCVPPPQWLQTLAAFKVERNAVMIAAPVIFDDSSSVLKIFQAMDFMVLQGITGAVVHRGELSMCNGANLAYDKKAFYDVDGFSGIDHIASGDDMLLMYKIMQKHPGRVHYLKSKNAMVTTRPAATWYEFFQQRKRWAAKATKYDDKRMLPVLLLVYLFNLSFLALLAAMCWSIEYGYWFLGLLVAKTIVELPLFCSVAAFFKKQRMIKWFVLFQPLHIMYTILAGLAGQVGKYEWKGRKVR